VDLLMAIVKKIIEAPKLVRIEGCALVFIYANM